MTVITATRRLARQLRREYDEKQLALGHSAWPAAEIRPLSAWLLELWETWLYASPSCRGVRLLRASEERAIWEEIVRSGDGGQILQIAATAEAALEAWNLLCAWNLPLDAAEWNDSADAGVFRDWATEFRRRLTSGGWLSGAQLPAFASECIREGAVPLPEQIEIAGFLDLTPLQERLFGSLQERGVQLKKRTTGDFRTEASRVVLKDPDAEIRAAAQWARHKVEHAPEERIGIVVPELAMRRGDIERIFFEEFHPQDPLRSRLESRKLFNISVGPSLAEYPIIDAAFQILGIGLEALSMEEVGRLLRSPFIAGAGEELSRRALLDRELRRMREPEVSIRDVLRMAEDPAAPHACSGLASRLRTWKEEFQATPALQDPSDWAASLARLLDAAGWPGDGPLNSTDFQTVAAWNALLGDFAGLDDAAGRLSLGTAVGMLRRLGANRQFQPESGPARVEILGLFEASGLSFDRLWIAGMHDEAWPRRARPDPFLPLGLQRRFHLPRSSPERELSFARLLTEQLLASAPEVLVSHADRQEDTAYRISPLFADLPEIPIQSLGVHPSVRPVDRLMASSRMEVLEDPDGPPFQGVAVGGGTAVFKHQAACPFRAFAYVRLGARALEHAQPGLSPLDRGLLLHDVLERVWTALGSHEKLMSLGADRLAGLVASSVSGAILSMSRSRRALRGSRFATIEQARMEKVVTEWLSLEKNRQPFTVLQQEKQRHVRIGGVEIRIRADRVDRLETGECIVIDYKSGEYSPSQWEGDRLDEPQLPVYAATAGAPLAGVFFGNFKAGRVGFRGLSVREGIVPDETPSCPATSLEDKTMEWRNVLDRLARDFRAGRAAVDPKRPGETCQQCSLPTFCRIHETQRVFENLHGGESSD